MNGRPALLFVYNADSGMFNTLADIGHKLFSPQTYNCALCALTHGYLSERKTWRAFIEGLDCDCAFQHRDEFFASHPELSTPLPAVFRLDEGRPVCCLDAETLQHCSDLDELQRMVRRRCCPSA